MTDRSTEATRATRKWQCTPGNVVYSLSTDGVRVCATQEEARAACDRLNLLAVLEALREPSEGMVTAAEKACGLWEGFLAEKGWRVMIDAAIAEVKNVNR